MVHPALFAVSVGIGIGAAIFLLFYTNQNNNHHQRRNAYQEHQHETWRDPLESMRRQFESDICSICLQCFNDSDVYLECRHRFHSECIEESLKHSRSCPLCRQNVKIMK